LLDSLQYWYSKTNNRITFEYVVWKGINDKKKDIEALVEFCKKVPSKVNLIEYNAIEEDGFQQADAKAIDYYVRELERNNIIVNVRRSRGKDIDAACGQLANKKG
ncbi:MAG: 23S rRNA (adenine(2503)-C(2))-methyltransferase RlmN, partial [Flavobacteriaceae bacterium]|nr:23S rRNA (adenine(2503)-C(2))-methyltransferase RlmN [Flavobacteriaceae bacterium]